MKKMKYVEIGAPGVTITGKIEATTNVCVSCCVNGDIETTGAIGIDKKAVIEGDVKAQSVFVANGSVHGDVIADDVVIARDGDVKGDIFCKTLQIDEGGMLLGRCSMNREEESLIETTQE